MILHCRLVVEANGVLHVTMANTADGVVGRSSNTSHEGYIYYTLMSYSSLASVVFDESFTIMICPASPFYTMSFALKRASNSVCCFSEELCFAVPP